MIWHSSKIEDVLSELSVDGEKGLTNGVADQRLAEMGPNTIGDNEQPSFLHYFLTQLKSKVVLALLIIAVISFAVSTIYRLDNAFSPLLIIAIVILNALISAYHLTSCVRSMNRHRSSINPQTVVLRDGIERTVSSEELVVGDILILSEGDFIPTDARILVCDEFRCNELPLTGENIPVEKEADLLLEDITPVDRRVNMVYRGCSVTHGNAKVVVTATGLNTETGHNVAIMQQTGEDVLPMTRQLENIGRVVNIIVLICCAVLFVISILQNFKAEIFAQMTVSSLMNAVALAVSAIPEGLPTVSTIVIALGIGRVIHDNIIIKKIDALEVLGNTSVILSDKTGILTHNKMSLVKVFDGENTVDLTQEPITEKISAALRLATTCSTLVNDSTEQAIERACITYNSLSKADIDNLYPRLTHIPFDSDRKTMTTVNMINQKPFAIVKGAPEMLAERLVGMDPQLILKTNESMAADALRVVLIAMKPLDAIPANPQPQDLENNLFFVGLLGLEDPPRHDSIEAIELCDQAGITTAMITGDNPLTAASIARRIGILKDGTQIVTGEDLQNISDEELAANIHRYRVFARVSTQDKVRIIEAYQKNGEVVTATGNRIYDSDALNVADVGCVIGKNRTDIANGSADVIITNNSFKSIISAIKESRGMFDNIRKSVHYLLSSNLGEIIAFIFGTLFFKCPPLAAVQLLWINLLTDCAPAISLCMEPAEETVLKSREFSPQRRIINRFHLISILAESLFIALMTLLVFSSTASSPTAHTMAFLTMGMIQVFHCLNHKIHRSLIHFKWKSNSFMNFSILITLFILLFLCFTPAGVVFGLEVLTFNQFLLCFACSVSIIPFCELEKFILKKF